MSYSLTKGQLILRVDPYRDPINSPPTKQKHLIADIIDTLDEHGGDPRLRAIATTKLEEASMWVTKFLTSKKPV